MSSFLGVISPASPNFAHRVVRRWTRKRGGGISREKKVLLERQLLYRLPKFCVMPLHRKYRLGL